MADSIEVLVPGGEADPGPPLGPELGPTPVDVQSVVQEINEETAAFDGTEVPVTVSYEDDGSFDIEIGVPPTAELIKDEAGFDPRSLHRVVVELLVELMNHAVEHAGNDAAVREFEAQLAQFDVAAFVDAYRREREFDTPV